jgi:hypothetical protein
LLRVLDVGVKVVRLRPHVEELVGARRVAKEEEARSRRLVNVTVKPLIDCDNITIHHEVLQGALIVLEEGRVWGAGNEAIDIRFCNGEEDWHGLFYQSRPTKISTSMSVYRTYSKPSSKASRMILILSQYACFCSSNGSRWMISL